MSENQQYLDELLVKYLLGEATPMEINEVEKWIAESEAHQKHLDSFRTILNESSKLSKTAMVDENEAWKRFQQRRQMPKNTTDHKKVNNISWWRIAALFILLVGVGGLVFNFYGRKENIRILAVQSAEATITDTLPDGSVITLNKHSQLSYASKFEKDSRTVSLQGEAFFNITPNKQKPFIIHVRDVTVKVVGTSFNIRNSGTKTEVIVETGVVQVIRNNKMVALQPKEKIVIDAKTDDLVKEKVADKLYNYYRSKEFVCDNTPLWKLVEVLNEAYDADIVIGQKSLRNLRLSTTFNNESLENILNVISLTFSIEVEHEGNKILLK